VTILGFRLATLIVACFVLSLIIVAVYRLCRPGKASELPPEERLRRLEALRKSLGLRTRTLTYVRSRVEDHGGQPPRSSAGCWAVVPAVRSEAMGQMGNDLDQVDMDLRREPVQGMRPRGAASGPCLVRSLASEPSVTRGEAAWRLRVRAGILRWAYNDQPR